MRHSEIQRRNTAQRQGLDPLAGIRRGPEADAGEIIFNGLGQPPRHHVPVADVEAQASAAALAPAYRLGGFTSFMPAIPGV